MLTIDDARHALLTATPAATETEFAPISDALDRVLAEEINSTIDVPPADNSAMDGYAVCSTSPNSDLQIHQRITAGTQGQRLKEGCAARIFTGAEIPPGADAVVMQENTATAKDSDELATDVVRIKLWPKAGENIRPKGQDIAKGAPVLSAGHRLKPEDLGLLASIGLSSVCVYKKIRVTLVHTGDELVAPGTPLKPGQIYNSNGVMLAALLQRLGCETTTAKAVGDTLEDTVACFEQHSKSADIIISTGGVSVGEEDHVKDAVEQLGELDLWKVKLKPGKPLAFGRIDTCTFIGLPGNPVSAFVTFALFARPVLKKRQGENDSSPLSFPLPLGFDIAKPRRRPEFIRARISQIPGSAEKHVEAFDNQSSGVLNSVSWANALAFIPEDQTLTRGDLVQIYPLDTLV